jgi:ADP-glucose pyrophosphorylase
LSLNLEFSYGLSFNLSDENEPLAYLSLNLVGHLSRDVCRCIDNAKKKIDQEESVFIMSYSRDFDIVINTTSTVSSDGSTLNKLSPLTETIPIPLIPVCNRPLVYYQLDLAVKSNFTSVVMVVEDRHEKMVRQKVDEYIKENKLGGVFRVDFVVVELSREGGDVEILRELERCKRSETKEPLLKKDFFFIGCDVVAGHVLYDLADAHRKHDASVALAYSGPAAEREEQVSNNNSKKQNKKKFADKTKKKNKKPSEYVGLARKSISCTKKNVTCARVVFSKLKGSFKESQKLVLPKALLAKCPHISMRSDLHSLNIYLFKKWILDLSRKKEQFTSIKDHLIPFLVNRDGRTFEDPLQRPRGKVSPVRQISDASVVKDEKTWEETEKFKVFSVVFPADANIFCGRTNSIKSYLSLSMDLMVESRNTKSDSSDLVDRTERPWPMVQKGFNRFFTASKEDQDQKKLWRKLQGFIAVELPNERPKGANCVIGKSVVLGKNVKLSNAVLMDGVQIEDDCTCD